MDKQTISVVIPCYNEGHSIHDNLEKIHSYLSSHFLTYEIIAVNDGSRDNTLAELQRFQAGHPLTIIDNRENCGKGKAVRDGILASQFEFVMFLDADLAIPIEELEKFMLEFDKGADLVIASRFVPGLKVIKPVLWHRKIMEKVFRLLRKVILNSWKIQDTQCGFKVMRGDIARRIFRMATIDRFAFDSEITFIAKKFGYAIKELPITLQNPTVSHVRIFIDPINMFFALLNIRMNDLRGIYKWK